MKKIIFILMLHSIFCVAAEINREFYEAVRKGNLALVEKMISLDFNKINGTDENSTPLNWAAESGQFEMVKYLLEKGAKVDSRNDIKDTPLKRACSMITDKKEQALVYYNISKLLIEYGADVNAKCGVSAWGGFDSNITPLHSAANNGNLEIVKLLVEHGADVNAINYEGFTPLHTAIVYTHNKDIVMYLISKGTDVNRKDKSNGNTLFFESLLRWKDLEISKMILDRGANINQPNKEGKTPLHYAVKWRNSEKTVKFLLANGADVNIKTKLGDTALCLAKEKGNKEIIELLIKAQKEQSSRSNSNN